MMLIFIWVHFEIISLSLRGDNQLNNKALLILFIHITLMYHNYRPPDDNFLVSQPKHMLWVLKKKSRRFF